MITKEQVINNIIVQCQVNLDDFQLKYLYEVLNKEFYPIEITQCEYEVGFVDTSFEQAIKMFVVSKRLKNCSPNTIENYMYALKKFRMYVNRPLTSISSTDIKFFLGSIMNEMSLVSVNNNRRALSSFFTWCNNEGYIASNPMNNVDSIKIPQVIKPSFNSEEMERMRNYFNSQKTNSIRNRALMEFLYSTGCRVGEVVRINIKDVDFSSKSIVVYGEKSKQYRIIYFSDVCSYYLKEYLSTRNDDNEALFICSKQPYQRLSKDAIEEIFKKCGRALGFTCNPHKFRRTVATDMINKGAGISSIQKLLGHKQSSTTLNYYADTKDLTVQREHERCIN